MTADVVVLLPTYNERDDIVRLVSALLAQAPVDVMVLDDASPDGTGQLADALAAENPRVKVVHRLSRQGLGRAYIDGMQRALVAGYAHIVQMDADLSHPPDVLPRLLAVAHTADVVLGSRNIAGGGTTQSALYRRWLSRMGSSYARLMLDVDVADLTGGFKCWSQRALQTIDLRTVRSEGYAFQIEMTYRAIQAGFEVVEVPFVFVERVHGKSKLSMRQVWEALLLCPRMRLTDES